MSAMASRVISVAIAQLLIQAHTKENIKAPRDRWKSSVTRKMVPFDDVIMQPIGSKLSITISWK